MEFYGRIPRQFLKHRFTGPDFLLSDRQRFRLFPANIMCESSGMLNFHAQTQHNRKKCDFFLPNSLDMPDPRRYSINVRKSNVLTLN